MMLQSMNRSNVASTASNTTDAERGFTLIELLVTIVIIGVIMAPMVKSYVFAWRTSIDASRRSKAVMLTNWKIEKLKSEKGYGGVADAGWSSCSLPKPYSESSTGVQFKCKVSQTDVSSEAVDPNFKAKKVKLKVSYPSVVLNTRRTINCTDVGCDEWDYATYFSKLKES